MKITKKDFQELKDAINSISFPGNLTLAQMRQKYVLQKFSMTRFVWDCLWVSGYDTTKLYKYLNDAHIETALKKILLKGDK
jgi:hypothetical protein